MSEFFELHPPVMIVDFGSQVTQLIARNVRELGVYCLIYPFDKAVAALSEIKPKAIILSGGPASVTDHNTPRIPEELLTAAVPVMAICYGQQAMVAQLGGEIVGSSDREFGRANIEILADSPLFKDVWQPGCEYQVWMSHSDKIIKLPPGFVAIAKSPGSPFAVISDERRQYYGMQFHPEVSHTLDGKKILRNFLFNIAGFKGDWTMTQFRDQEIARIRAQVGDKQVVCALSGGVDSSVAAILIHQAIGDQLTCIFVDHGLLRANEADEVIALFKLHHKLNIKHIKAHEQFLSALDGVTDPEQKRKIIGNLFIELFEREAEEIDGAEFLAQGTLYPDVVESTTAFAGPSAVIKSHHNVGGLPERMNLKLIEPLRELFKDEVRVLGRELGLHGDFINRHPFPGPGLAIRIPGAIDRLKLDILRQVDAIYLREIINHGLYDEIWQAFALLLPVKTVGVMGDDRSYEYVAALRAVCSRDGMTAEFYPFDMAFLDTVSTRIVNEVKGVNRVVYDITSKPPGTIEWE